MKKFVKLLLAGFLASTLLTFVFVDAKDTGAAGDWDDWTYLGGNVKYQPSCVSWAADRVDCFAVHTDGAMWQIWWNGSNWSPWVYLGGDLSSAPNCIS